MKYTEIDNKIILTDYNSFDIEETLECGQCFRFEKLAEKKYKITAYSKVLTIEQTDNEIIFTPCNKEDFENIWKNYFDLDRDYLKIKAELSATDEIMKKAVEYADGIRILNQEPFECILSFIISQNNNIPRIKGIIAKMSEKYGTKQNDNYFFPNLEQLQNATVDELFELKMGFRAKYIYDAVQKFGSEIDINNLLTLETDEVRKQLMAIKGIGQKVADCSLMFSFGRREVFPTDVWVKRVMEYFYFNEENMDIKVIHAFAKEKWGDLAGYAQQYLFYYARTLKLGKKDSKIQKTK
jgi:N-glycosylase/DNA lyase